MRIRNYFELQVFGFFVCFILFALCMLPVLISEIIEEYEFRKKETARAKGIATDRSGLWMIEYTIDGNLFYIDMNVANPDFSNEEDYLFNIIYHVGDPKEYIIDETVFDRYSGTVFIMFLFSFLSFMTYKVWKRLF